MEQKLRSRNRVVHKSFDNLEGGNDLKSLKFSDGKRMLILERGVLENGKKILDVFHGWSLFLFLSQCTLFFFLSLPFCLLIPFCCLFMKFLLQRKVVLKRIRPLLYSVASGERPPYWELKWLNSASALLKGQLVSKANFKVFIWTKNDPEKFEGYLPYVL